MPWSDAHCKALITSVDFPDEEIPYTRDFFMSEGERTAVRQDSQLTIHCSKLVSLINDVATTPEPGQIAFFCPLDRRVMSTAV